MAHTPGPWGIIGRDVYAPIFLAIGDEQIELYPAFHEESSAEFPEAIANAHLIAAAPELLETLKRMLSHMEPVAIAYYKRHENTPSWKSESTSDLFEAILNEAREAIAKAEGR